MRKGYNIDAGRTPEQIAQMKQLAKDGICAFCRENLEEHHANPVELETAHWVVTKNDYPYEGTSLHLLLISKLHVDSFAKLPLAAQQDYGKVIAAIEKRWKLDSYFVGMRSGDARFNGGSVDHLHAHVLVGQRDSEKFQVVRMKAATLPND